MVMTTNMINETKNSQAPGKDDPVGEIRADADGKLYVYIPKGDEKKEVVKEDEKINFDLNGDGVVDAKDVRIAAKVMRRFRGKK